MSLRSQERAIFVSLHPVCIMQSHAQPKPHELIQGLPSPSHQTYAYMYLSVNQSLDDSITLGAIHAHMEADIVEKISNRGLNHS